MVIPRSPGVNAREGLDDEDDEIESLPLNEFEKHEKETVQFTTRLPSELAFEIKLRSIRSTAQILAEHAFATYLGSRLPPSLLGGYEWPEEYPEEPKPEYLSSQLKSYSVRLPRHLLRWARVHAAEAEISEQELAVRVFDWYVRTKRIPPNKEDVQRNRNGRLVISETLIGNQFHGYDGEKIMAALDLLVERHEMYGGPLAGDPSAPAKYAAARKRRKRGNSRPTTRGR